MFKKISKAVEKFILSFLGLKRPQILDDSEINCLLVLYDLAPTPSEFKTKKELLKHSKIEEEDWLSAANNLKENGYMICNQNLKESKFRISFSGKLLVYELEKNAQSLVTAYFGILVSIFVGLTALWFAGLDYLGDKNWQENQLIELKKLNQNLELLK